MAIGPWSRPFAAVTPPSRSTSACLAFRASGRKRGTMGQGAANGYVAWRELLIPFVLFAWFAINFEPYGTGTLSQNGDNNQFAQQL